MPEYRKDPLSNRWVLIAEQRAERPDEFQQVPTRRMAESCAFCAGSEHETPPAVAQYSHHASPPWQVRVVPNKYPACDATLASSQTRDGLLEACGGRGVHEVIIESPQHHASFSELSAEEACWTYRAYRDRMRNAAEQQLPYAQVFKNVGMAAGASLEHSHSQLLAPAMIPPQLELELQRSEEFYREHRRCLMCRLIEQERRAGDRVVAETANLLAICPYASRFPYEMWVLPREHASDFRDCGHGLLDELALFVQRLVARLEAVLERPAYNYLLHSAPFTAPQLDHYHWRMEIFPRVTRPAGFEWGSGCFINPVPPEQAASSLRLPKSTK